MNPTNTSRVWLVRLDELNPDSAEARRYASWLSQDEQARQRKFRQPDAQHRFMLSRALLRSVLGNLTGQPPPSLQFTVTKNGKPGLTGNPDIHFSLSHSGQWIALAVSDRTPVGIDLEHPLRTRDHLKIAGHFFHADEFSWLDAQTGPGQRYNFYRLWTLKEAFFKARGTGISEGLSRITFSNLDARPVGHLAPELAPQLDTQTDANARWHFFYSYDPITSGDELHLALAGQNSSISAPEIIRGLPGGEHTPIRNID